MIQLPDPGTGVPADKAGDSPWLAMKKVRENFADQTNAASRLVGTGAGQVMQVGAFGLGSGLVATSSTTPLPTGFYYGTSSSNLYGGGRFFLDVRYTHVSPAAKYQAFRISNTLYTNDFFLHSASNSGNGELNAGVKIWHSGNATRDPNGFLKGASPIAEIYSDKVDLNDDAERQGGITFEKLGVGDYLVKGSLGFAQEGWYIETPKDANGNVLVAVVYKQLANNDISIKTYAKKFDDETGDIVPNLTRPRDIPEGRFISLRLHELPVEPPVMPMDVDEPKPEV